MSRTGRRLKPPRSLSYTSTHPHHGYPNVTVMAMTDWLTSISFHVNQPYHPWNFRVEVMGVVKRTRPCSRSSIFLICFRFVSLQSNNNAWDTAILKFDLDKIQGQGHGCCQRSRPHSSTSIQQMSIRPIIPEICPIECLTLTETHSKF